MFFPSQNFDASLTQKKLLACISPFQGMHPPSINFSQLPQFHKSWCSHFHPIWKKVCKKIVFSSNISKIPEFILNKEMEHRKKQRKKHRKKREMKKSSKSLSFKKGEFNIMIGEKILKTFPCESIFSPLHFTTSKTLFQIIWKFLTLLEPSLSLAIYLTWVAFFSYAWAPHIHPLNDRKNISFEPRWGNTYQKIA
jgi:hypothetical protein